MRAVLLVGALSLTVAACATTPVRPLSRPVPLATGSVDAFVPLVEASDQSPRCEARDHDLLAPGQRAVALVYGGGPPRRVTVTVDEDLQPVRYVDDRGDLSARGRSGDRTTIGLYLDADYAVLSNRPRRAPAVIVEVPLSDAIESRKLGDPRAVIRRVMSECAEVL